MNHRLLYLLLVFNLSFLHLEAQHENDVWITGYPANEDTFDYPDTGINKIFGNNLVKYFVTFEIIGIDSKKVLDLKSIIFRLFLANINLRTV